ncbi:MAG: hypothetical protein QGF09_07185, partial [Rhodospirillales bacterium]|nr:hypothetical protein [Rhodospirillales bacterium]
MLEFQTRCQLGRFRDPSSAAASRQRFARYALPVALIFSAILWAGSALAWDAGPKSCEHAECSGGALKVSTGVPDTQPKYAKSRGIPKGTGRVADCPNGYTNNGATCGRRASSYGNSTHAASCPRGWKNMGLYCGKGVHTMGMSKKGLP